MWGKPRVGMEPLSSIPPPPSGTEGGPAPRTVRHVLAVGGGRIERLSFSRASEFVALLQGLFEDFLLGGCERAIGRLLFKAGDGFLNLNNFTGGRLNFLVSFM